MSDDWSPGELTRAVKRIEEGLAALSKKVDDLRWRPFKMLQSVGMGIAVPLIVTALGVYLFGKGA